MKKNENMQLEEHAFNDSLLNNEEFSFNELNTQTKSNNKISSATNSKNFKAELTTEDKNTKLLKLSDNLILNILGFLTMGEKINTIIFNRRLQMLTKIKLRHIKLKKFFFELFNPDFSTEAICKFITENENFTNILNRFKLMTESDIIRSLSLFLTDLFEANKDNNVFYTKFDSLVNIEFTNKFLNLHELKNTKLVISIDEFFSPYFYGLLNKNQILIHEIIISEKSKKLKEVFNHHAYKFKINKIKFVYEDEDFNSIKGLETVREYFFNAKNSVCCLEVVKAKKLENQKEESTSVRTARRCKSLVGHHKNLAAKVNGKATINSIYRNKNEINNKNNNLDAKYFEEEKQNEVFYDSNNSENENTNDYKTKHNHLEMHHYTNIDASESKLDKLRFIQKRNTYNTNLVKESISSIINNNCNDKNKKISNILADQASADSTNLDKLIDQQQSEINFSLKKNSVAFTNLNKNTSITEKSNNNNKNNLNNNNNLKSALAHQSKILSPSNSFRGLDAYVSNEDEILNIIEFNSESIISLNLNMHFEDALKFVKTLGRCRQLQKLHLELSTAMVNKFLSSFTLYRSFLLMIDLLKELKDFSCNALVFVREEIVEKMRYKKIKSLDFKFPSYILTDLNEKFSVVRKFALSFPFAKELNLTIQNIELSYNSKFSYMNILNEKKKGKNKEFALIAKLKKNNNNDCNRDSIDKGQKSSCDTGEPNFIQSNSSLNLKAKLDSENNKNNKNNNNYKNSNHNQKNNNTGNSNKEQTKSNENSTNEIYNPEAKLLSNTKIRDLILNEENEKLKKLDQVLNNDNLRNGYFDLIFQNFKSLEILKVIVDGKKKIKFEELDLESTNNILNTPSSPLNKDFVEKTNLPKLEEIKDLENKKEKEEAKIETQNQVESVKTNQENKIKEKEEINLVKENQIKHLNEALDNIKNKSLFQFYTTSKGNHNVVTIKDAFHYNKDINNFCFIKNAYNSPKNYHRDAYNNNNHNNNKLSNSSKKSDNFISENEINKFKNRSYSNFKSELKSFGKKPFRKKVSLENKDSAYIILNNRRDFPDLKEFLPISKGNRELKSIKHKNKLFNLNENNQITSCKNLNEFYTEDNLNINFKKNFIKEKEEEAKNKKQFVFLDKKDSTGLNKYAIIKYNSMQNLNQNLFKKPNYNPVTEDSQNCNFKKSLFTTKNNSIKIFSKIGNIDASKIHFARANLKTPTLSSRICNSKGFNILQDLNKKSNAENESRNIFSSQNKLRNNNHNSTFNSDIKSNVNYEEEDLKKFDFNIEMEENNTKKPSVCMDDSINAIENKDKNQNENRNDNKSDNELCIPKSPNATVADLTDKSNNNNNNNNHFNIHKKQISEISKIDINQIEAEIKKRDEEIIKKNIDENNININNNSESKLNNIEENKIQNPNLINIKTNYYPDAHSKFGSRATSKHSRKGGLSSSKNQNKKASKFNEQLTPLSNLEALNNKKFEKEKEAKENPEEIFFCERLFTNLILCLIPCLNLKILDLSLSTNINLDILSENLYLFINSSKSIRRVKISTNSDKEEFTIKEKTNYVKESIFEFKARKINEKILDSAKILITKNIDCFDPNAYYIIYKGSIKLFCIAFKSFKNLFLVNFLKELTLQEDEINLKQAYAIREIIEKASNLEHFALKSLLLKCDFFEIVADKIHFNKLLRKIIFCDLKDVNEKSLNIFFKRLHSANINFLVLEKLDIGEIFLSYISQVKNLFPKLLSFTFKPNKKLFHGISLLGEFFRNNASLYEFRININNVMDFYKLDEIITDYRFIKFELD